MHYRLSCRHFHATHTSVPTDTACVSIQIRNIVSHIIYKTELVKTNIILWRQWVFTYFFQTAVFTTGFVSFLDNQQWIIHIWNILYFSFNRLCTSTGVGSSYSRVTSLLSWIVIYRTQPSPQMNEYKTWMKRTNQPKLMAT